MSRRTNVGDYEVGYGRPPKATQFQKGRSGNPSGRRRGARSAKSLLSAVLGTRIPVKEGGQTKRLLPLEVIYRQLLNKALQGDLKSILLVLRLAEEHRVVAPDLVQGRDYGVLVVPAMRSPQEWAERYGPGGTHASPPAPGDERFDTPPKKVE